MREREIYLDRFAAQGEAEGAVRVRPPQGEPGGLADAVPVHHGPGDDGPAVVELPDDRPGAHRLQGAPVTDPECDRARLVELRGPVPPADVRRLGQVTGEPLAQLPGAVLGLLVDGELVAVGGQGRIVNGADQGGPRNGARKERLS